MKKYSILVLVLVLTAALLTGCGCTNRDMATVPTTLPTTAATTAPTHATTEATTEYTTVPTTETRETIDNGNGPLEDNTTGATNATDGAAEGRARSRASNVR